ncbi:MAG: class I SAM-dependent methyltransferase [Candidatus Kariarchaeaceae archaeon]|jgi:2-polyprenyl-3-methyl-5-hydroxy-6-metoxy-1,4-benzoquinol methylase
MKEKDIILDLNKRAWEKVVNQFDSYRTPIPVTHTFKDFCEMDRLYAGARILDIGCGTGIPFTRYLVNKGFQVVGLDVSEKMLDLARRNVPSGDYRNRSMTEMQFEQVFDAVVASYSMLLLNVELFTIAAKRIAKALKTRGLFYLSLNEPKEEEDPDKDAFVEIMGEKMYSRGYTETEVRDIFGDLNFTLLKISRNIEISPEFGEEHMVEYIFEKAT